MSLAKSLVLICADNLSDCKNTVVVTDHFICCTQSLPARIRKAPLPSTECTYSLLFTFQNLFWSEGGFCEPVYWRNYSNTLNFFKVLNYAMTPNERSFNWVSIIFSWIVGHIGFETKIRWSQHMNNLVHAYNCTKNYTMAHSNLLPVDTKPGSLWN